MQLRRRVTGEVLMAVGVLCGVLYVLINMSGFPAAVSPAAVALPYLAIGTICVGLVMYLSARARGV